MTKNNTKNTKHGIKFTLKTDEVIFLEMTRKQAKNTKRCKWFNLCFKDDNGKQWDFSKNDVKRMEII